VEVFSRKAVGAKVHAEESMEHSSRLIDTICHAEGVEKHQVSVHADNGGPMKGATMRATLQRLDIGPSFSRPSGSNDNPFSESLFRTLKYCPSYPTTPFASLDAARAWVATFLHWYNHEQLHSGIRFTTPASRHAGTDTAILHRRDRVYHAARSIPSSRAMALIYRMHRDRSLPDYDVFQTCPASSVVSEVGISDDHSGGSVT